MAGQFGAARIVIEGHTDSSMKGRVPEDVGSGALRESGQCGEGSDPEEIPDASAEPVHGVRSGLELDRRIRATP